MSLARLKRFAPLTILLLGLVAFFAFGLDKHFTFEALRESRDSLQAYSRQHPVLGPLAFAAAYAMITFFSIPIAALMSMTAGFLFGMWIGGAMVVLGASTGGVLAFLAARTALGDALRRRIEPALKRMDAGFRKNTFSYLLFLRLMPLFPFWLVNVAPALAGVNLRDFYLATIIGVVPASFVFASVGHGLGAVLGAGGTPDLGILLTPSVLLPIAGLALLSLVPVIYRLWRTHREPASGGTP